MGFSASDIVLLTLARPNLAELVDHAKFSRPHL
jgi:hypothetical protein